MRAYVCMSLISFFLQSVNKWQLHTTTYTWLSKNHLKHASIHSLERNGPASCVHETNFGAHWISLSVLFLIPNFCWLKEFLYLTLIHLVGLDGLNFFSYFKAFEISTYLCQGLKSTEIGWNMTRHGSRKTFFFQMRHLVVHDCIIWRKNLKFLWWGLLLPSVTWIT